MISIRDKSFLVKVSGVYLSLSLAVICKPVNADTPGPVDVEKGISAFEAGEYGRAVILLEPPAQHGHADALYLLGTIHEEGLGVKTDDARAEYYYWQAASRGHRDAQFALGMIYLGVDNEEAERWLELALSGNHPNARYVLDTIHSGLFDDVC